MDADRLLRFKLGKTAADVDRAIAYLTRCAYANVPAVRQRLDAARIPPQEIASVRALSQLPAVRRSAFSGQTIAPHLHRRADPHRCHVTTTTGSTGQPLTVLASRTEAWFRRYLIYRAARRTAHVGLPLRILEFTSGVSHRMARSVVRWGVVTVVRIPAFSPVEDELRLFRTCRPHLIEGFPTRLELFAEATRTADLGGWRPRAVITRGELLHETVRAKIRAAFDCPVIDFYNCEEVGNIAWECPDRPRHYHVNTDACFLEILDENDAPLPAGEEGQIVLTNLYNCTRPFLRYAIGDRGVLASPDPIPCSCGATTPILAALSGRDMDFVYLPDGRRISPAVISTVIDNAATALTPDGTYPVGLRRFQLVQEEVGAIRVRVVLAPDTELDLERILLPPLQALHPRLRCAVERVNGIPLEPGGKFREVVCRVRSPG